MICYVSLVQPHLVNKKAMYTVLEVIILAKLLPRTVNLYLRDMEDQKL